MAVHWLTSPWRRRESSGASSSRLNPAVTDIRETSPPLASRTLLVSECRMVRPASCSETIAITPTAMQKTASTVRYPCRASERVE